jgi:hypothetical protein
MKLFTIGDSVSQGFMSGAAARSDQAYSTLIARKLGLSDYRLPIWKKGIPLDLESIVRILSAEQPDNDVRFFEWPGVISRINELIDQVEDFYERGEGRSDLPEPSGYDWFHNVAVQGFKITDAWQVKPEGCKTAIAENADKEGQDNWGFSFPSATFHRIALKVLNPALKSEYDQFSQIDWLKYHAGREAGIENVLLWLGANNALGTVMGFAINETPGAGAQAIQKMPWKGENGREKLNLWHPRDFKEEYIQLLDQIDQAMQTNQNPNWQVFVGTVPLVTIAPFAEGRGASNPMRAESQDQRSMRDFQYFDYYTYFFRPKSGKVPSKGVLSRAEVIKIDNYIRQYNQTIKDLVKERNQQYGKARYHIVDLSATLENIALKRNQGIVRYEFPEYFKSRSLVVNTRYYDVDRQGNLRAGGLFSLDGIHPSAIGQGIIAYEFLKVMQTAGVVNDAKLDWAGIFASDNLYSRPIPLMQELYENEMLANTIVQFVAKS